MNVLITLSLLLNIAVLLPVCTGLITSAGWAQASFGEATPARGILLSVYLSIAFASALLVVFRDPKPVAVLLWLQIIYKLTTPLNHPRLEGEGFPPSPMGTRSADVERDGKCQRPPGYRAYQDN